MLGLVDRELCPVPECRSDPSTTGLDARSEIPQGKWTPNMSPRPLRHCLLWLFSSHCSGPDQTGNAVPEQSQCPLGSTAFQLVLNSFGSTGRFGLTCSHEAPSGVVGRAFPAAH